MNSCIKIYSDQGEIYNHKGELEELSRRETSVRLGQIERILERENFRERFKSWVSFAYIPKFLNLLNAKDLVGILKGKKRY